MISEPLAGVFRSLRTYHGRSAPRQKMDALYKSFVGSGDLVFDIGAHTGDRVSSFRRLGAHVVAVEPQPLLQRALRRIHGQDPRVTLVPCAAAQRKGERTLHINARNPAVSTLSKEFISNARGAGGWEGQVWNDTITVPAVSLDDLIARFGRPAFVKIDVEGYEDEVLAGLSTPITALSFEFTTIARDVSVRALEQVSALGPYRFNLALGETQTLTFARWVTESEMKAHLMGLPHAANSGDIYARLD